MTKTRRAHRCTEFIWSPGVERRRCVRGATRRNGEVPKQKLYLWSGHRWGRALGSRDGLAVSCLCVRVGSPVIAAGALARRCGPEQLFQKERGLRLGGAQLHRVRGRGVVASEPGLRTLREELIGISKRLVPRSWSWERYAYASVEDGHFVVVVADAGALAPRGSRESRRSSRSARVCTSLRIIAHLPEPSTTPGFEQAE